MKKETKKLITIEELSKLSDISITAIAKYVRQGLLKYSKQDEDFIRYYPKSRALKRLKEIEKMNKNGYTLQEMRNRFSVDDEEIRFMVIEGPDTEKLFKDDKEKQAYINYIEKKKEKEAKGSRLPCYIISLTKEEVLKNFKDFLKKKK